MAVTAWQIVMCTTKFDIKSQKFKYYQKKTNIETFENREKMYIKMLVFPIFHSSNTVKAKMLDMIIQKPLTGDKVILMKNILLYE